MAASFTLSQEQTEAMMLAPEGAKVLQTLAAQSTVRAYENVMASVVTLLPDMIRNIVAAQTANNKLWGEFFTAHPHLEAKRTDIYGLAAQYRQANPQTPADQLMREIAALAAVRLGLAPVPAAVPVQQTAQQPMRQIPARPVAVPPRPPVAPAGVAGGAVEDDGVPDYLRDMIDLQY
jgi:hypothetical protein